jgi:hypothetical protein
MRGTKQQRHYSLTILHIFGVLQSGRLCGNTKKTQTLTSHRYKLTFSIAKFYPMFLFLIYSSSQSSSRHISLILYIYEMKCAGYTNLDHQNRRNTGAQGCLAGVARAVLRTTIADLQYSTFHYVLATSYKLYVFRCRSTHGHLLDTLRPCARLIRGIT